ncbi:MAG: TrmH family RNA methyltransferase [Gemmatimonadales bacterium]
MSPNLIKTIRNLQQRKARRRTGLTRVEGVRLVEEAVRWRMEIVGVVTREVGTDERLADLVRVIEANVAVERLPEGVFDDLATADSPQGIIAVVAHRPAPLDSLSGGMGRGYIAALDGIQDPGNVGTIIRSARALRARAVVLLPGCADLLNPKVIRASMGASFGWPVCTASRDEMIAWTRGAGAELWIAEAGGDEAAPEVPQGGMTLVLGSEAAGVSADLAAAAVRSIGVNIGGDIDSLNVAVAAGILFDRVARSAE